MGSKEGFCQHDAGILKNDKLSPEAKAKFVQEVKDELIRGTAGVPVPPLPCGPKVEPIPSMKDVPLEDESKYPDFHKNALGMYENIAKALDGKGSFSMLPICDPVALAVSLGMSPPDLKFPDEFAIYGFALPLLAIKLGFDVPVDLAAKFPSLPIPEIPPKLPIPEFKLPIDDFRHLFEFNAAFYGGYPPGPPKLLNLIVELVGQMPSLALGILSFNLRPFCDAVLKSGMFGPFDPNSAIVWVVASKVLARKTAECILIRVVAMTMGSSSGGIVGGLGKFLGYVPPPGPKTTSDGSVREKVVKGAKSANNTSLGADLEQLSTTAPDKLRLKYTSFLLPVEVDDGKKGKAAAAAKKAKSLNAGFLFARACLFRGGATEDFYTSETPSNVGGQLSSLAQNRRAKITISTTNFPKLKKGDIVICDNGSLVLSSDYSGGSTGSLSGVFAGLPDSKNDDKFTAIKQVTMKASVSASNVVLTHDKVAYRVSYAIDVDKMLKTKRE